MTIQFNCPNCNAVIAFDDKHCGKRARCTTCGQLFIIPSKDNEKPKKVELPKEKGQLIPGFYRAVFVDNWKLFLDSENVTSLVFVVAVICFKFFSSRSCCCGFVTHYVVWGWLLGFYLNIIYETAFEIDKLPEIYLGTSITFLWYVIKPFFLFSVTMAVAQLPFIIALILLKDEGMTIENIWQAEFGLLHVLFILGLFLFPIAILTTAVGKDITMFRPDYLLRPVFKAFIPYLVTVVLLIAAALLET
ncbi:MAG: zinc ribbon domain-containing protein, partial [Planctomycetota bacterium]